MMIACADYARGKGNAPDELDLAFDCQSFGALPYAGGILDQPAGLIAKMRSALNIYHAMQDWEHNGRKKAPDWISKNPQRWKIVKMIMELRNGEHY